MIAKISDARLLAGAALIVPSIGMIAPLGIAPVLALLAVTVLVIGKRRRLVLSGPLLPLTILLAAMALWGGLSASWSVIPAHSLFEAARFLLLSAAGLVVVAAALTLDEAGRAQVGRASLVGFALALALAVVEIAGDFPVRRALSSVVRDTIGLNVLDRGATVLSLACWAPVLFLARRGRGLAAAIVVLVALATLYRLLSLSAVLGIVTAAAGFALGWWRPRAAAVLLAGGIALLAVVLPFHPPTRDAVIWLIEAAPWLRTSAEHRLVIWHFTSGRVAERPLLGWGMDASRAIPGGQADVHDYMDLPAIPHLEGAVMPLHPHDAILQWSVELGIGGTILGAAIVICIAWLAGFSGKAPRATRAAGFAVIAAALPPLLLNFGVWQAWWQSTLWIVAALVIAVGGAPRPTDDVPPARPTGTVRR